MFLSSYSVSKATGIYMQNRHFPRGREVAVAALMTGLQAEVILKVAGL